jgi:hypothetical protein
MFRFRELSLSDFITEFFKPGPLLYVLLWFSHTLSGAHPFIILKAFGPLLYGGLAVSFFVFMKWGMGMNDQTGFIGTLLLIFQVAALRMGWDRFRNLLGLIFVFIVLTILKGNHKRKWWLISVLAVLTVLSREYIGFFLFMIIIGFVFLEKKDRAPALIALTPVLLILIVMVYPTQLWWNYMLNSAPPFISRSYLELVQDVLSIFVISYLPLLFFVIKGFSKEKLLSSMIGWLLLGSFSVVIIPWLAIPGYQRWLMLLVFPFSIYAIRSFEKLHSFNKNFFKKSTIVILFFAVIGLGYSSGVFSYVGFLNNSWVPANLIQSSIAWEHIEDTKRVLRWLNENAAFNSSLLAEERFYGWALIYLKRANDDVKVASYEANFSPQAALERMLNEGYQWIYLIWYTDSKPENFHVIYSLNDIAIFQYES